MYRELLKLHSDRDPFLPQLKGCRLCLLTPEAMPFLLQEDTTIGEGTIAGSGGSSVQLPGANAVIVVRRHYINRDHFPILISAPLAVDPFVVPDDEDSLQSNYGNNYAHFQSPNAGNLIGFHTSLAVTERSNPVQSRGVITLRSHPYMNQGVLAAVLLHRSAQLLESDDEDSLEGLPDLEEPEASTPSLVGG